jgi:hypothetical protein
LVFIGEEFVGWYVDLYLWLARGIMWFDGLVGRCLFSWICGVVLGEGKLVIWLGEVYLLGFWRLWFVGGWIWRKYETHFEKNIEATQEKQKELKWKDVFKKEIIPKVEKNDSLFWD